MKELATELSIMINESKIEELRTKLNNGLNVDNQHCFPIGCVCFSSF
jgi:hypothetical protein